MESAFNKFGAWSVIALMGAVVLLYSLWGASVLHAQNSGSLTKAPSAALTTNL